MPLALLQHAPDLAVSATAMPRRDFPLDRCAEDHGPSAQIEPEQEDGDAAQRTVEAIERTGIAHISGKRAGGADPQQGRDDCAPVQPARMRPRPARREAVQGAQAEHERQRQQGPADLESSGYGTWIAKIACAAGSNTTTTMARKTKRMPPIATTSARSWRCRKLRCSAASKTMLSAVRRPKAAHCAVHNTMPRLTAKPIPRPKPWPELFRLSTSTFAACVGTNPRSSSTRLCTAAGLATRP